MKIKVGTNGTVARAEHATICDAMNVLGNCISYSTSTGGFIDENGEDRILLFANYDREDVSEAIETVASIFGIEIKEGER